MTFEPPGRFKGHVCG